MSRRNQGPRLKWLAKRNCFYIVWTEHGRSRERSTGTADSGQAEAAFGEWLQARGRRGGPSDPSGILVTDVLASYASERGEKVESPERIAYAIDPLLQFWQGLAVSDVTPLTCSRYAAQRGRSDGTIRRELGVLRAAINYSHRCGRITRTVAVELPARPDSRDRWLTRNEAAAIIRSARTPQARLYLPLFILIGLYTGRRTEAILGLRWPQVDLKACRINFERIGRKKTNKRRGQGVPISPRLLPHLRRAKKRGTDLGPVIHRDGERLGKVLKGFKAACARAGVDDASPHTLRHTAATWLMQAGTDPWVASGYLAMSLETLLRVYGHHHPDHQRSAAENIGRRPQNVRVIQ